MKIKKEDIDLEEISTKRIKIERSPLSKSKFPPISKYEVSFESGTLSPYRKFYEDNSIGK